MHISFVYPASNDALLLPFSSLLLQSSWALWVGLQLLVTLAAPTLSTCRASDIAERSRLFAISAKRTQMDHSLATWRQSLLDIQLRTSTNLITRPVHLFLSWDGPRGRGWSIFSTHNVPVRKLLFFLILVANEIIFYRQLSVLLLSYMRMNFWSRHCTITSHLCSTLQSCLSRPIIQLLFTLGSRVLPLHTCDAQWTPPAYCRNPAVTTTKQ